MNINVEKLLDEADQLVRSFMYDQAITKYNYILEHTGDCDQALLMRGALLGEMGHIDRAITDIEKSIKLNNTKDLSFITLAYLYERKNDYEKAIDLCRSSISLNKKNKDAVKLIIRLCENQGYEMLTKCQFDKAEFFLKLALIHKGNDASLLYKLALVASSKGDVESSVALSEKVIEIDPNHINAKVHIASSYEMMGDIDKGNQLIEDLICDYPNHPLVTIVYAQYALRSKKQEEGISVLRKLISNNIIKKYDLISAKMLLGKLYDSIGKYESAFECFKQANELEEDGNYDSSSYQEYISGLINYFSKEKYQSIAVSENITNELIFIVGMPRSGTSLIEKIISSHSNVFGAGELSHVEYLVGAIKNDESGSIYPECLDGANADTMNKLADWLIEKIREEGDGSEKIIDKMPNNFHHIGFLHKLFPNAKFINCVRDARDTCLSIFFQSFTGYHPYASNLHALGVRYHEYKRLMKYWENELRIPVLTVSYENVVTDTRSEIERLLDFLELDWEEKCMEFYKQKRTTATASYNQVNREIYTSSIGRWKNYKDNISELLDVLGEQSF